MNNTGEYEKIQLSKQDLRYIYGQIYNNTTAKLDLHLPTSNIDVLKKNVAGLLDEYLMDAFEMACNALVVDGQELSTKLSHRKGQRRQDDEESRRQVIRDLLELAPREKIEPFDFELNGELRKLLQRVEEETIEVTQYRKEIPLKAMQEYERLVARTDDEVTGILRKLEKEAKQEAQIESVDEYPIINEDRLNMIEQDYEEALLKLNELKRSIPGEAAEIERLDDTIKFLEGLNGTTTSPNP
ncbi:kinetochore-associated protein Nsl1p [[Candida] anglica]|uniref:Kinetochore-associated protein Nsl1p n=1 Tax=[Candida] anglica TaxID=148631 RepID=A0ABP0E5T0_9ASCO